MDSMNKNKIYGNKKEEASMGMKEERPQHNFIEHILFLN